MKKIEGNREMVNQEKTSARRRKRGEGGNGESNHQSMKWQLI